VREREREGEKTKRDWLRVQLPSTAFNCLQLPSMADERNNATTSFPRPLLFRSFPRPIAAIAEGRTLHRSAKKRTCLGGEETKEQACGSPKREAKKKKKKVRDRNKSKRCIFLIFLFFFSHACSSSPLRRRVLRKEGPTARPQAYLLIVCEITEQRKIGLFRALFSRILQSEFIGFCFFTSLWPR